MTRGRRKRQTKKLVKDVSLYDAAARSRKGNLPRYPKHSVRHRLGHYTATEMEEYHRERVRGNNPATARRKVRAEVQYKRAGRLYKSKPRPDLLKFLFG